MAEGSQKSPVSMVATTAYMVFSAGLCDNDVVQERGDLRQ